MTLFKGTTDLLPKNELQAHFIQKKEKGSIL